MIWKSQFILILFSIAPFRCLHKGHGPSLPYQSQSLLYEESIDPEHILIFLQSVRKHPDYDRVVSSLMADPITRYWTKLDEGVSAVQLRLPSRNLILSPDAVAQVTQKKSLAQRQNAALYESVKSYLTAQKIDEKQLKESDIASAWLSLAALAGGDATFAEKITPSGLSLFDPLDRARDLLKIAKIGKRASNSQGAAIAAAMDPETWHLINRNRKVLGFAINVAEKLDPENLEVKRNSRLIKLVLTAAEIITDFQDFDKIPPEGF